MSNEMPQKLLAMPAAFISLEGGVIVKRGCTELHICGEHISDIIHKVYAIASGDHGATRQQICEQFPPSAHSQIEGLIEQLVLRKLLMPTPASRIRQESPESNVDIFYWHFDTSQEEVLSCIGFKRIVVLGVNELSRHLAISLTVAGFRNIRVVDHPLLRNANFFDVEGNLNSSTWTGITELPSRYDENLTSDSLDCLIATSDFGITPSFHDLNNWCILNNRHFFPVVLQNMVGYVGPLVIPGESPCYECVRCRVSSHLEEPEIHRATEKHSFSSQTVVSFHPLMISILANIAAFDLFKFYSEAIEYEIGTLIEIRALTPSIARRKVLKIPRCPTCSPMMTRPSTTLKKSMFTFSEPDA